MGQLASLTPWIVTAGLSLLSSALLWRMPGTDDIDLFWLPWMEAAVRSGIVDGYRELSNDYPPGTLALLYLARKLAWSLSDRETLKLLAATAQLLAGWCFLWGSRSTGLTAAFVASTMLSASALGYLDILYAPPLLVALFAAARGRPSLSILAFALSCSIKWQPALLFPFLAIQWFRHYRLQAWRGALPTMLALVGLLLLLAIGFWPTIFEAFLQVANHPHWSGNALNLPWLIQIVAGHPPEAAYILQAGRIPLKAAFFLVYIALFVFALRRDALTGGCLAFAAYFVLNPGVHENHLFVPMLVGLTAWAMGERFAFPAITLSVLANVNLLVFYGVSGTPPFAPDRVFALATGGLSLLYLLAVLAIGASAFGPSAAGNTTRSSVRQ